MVTEQECERQDSPALTALLYLGLSFCICRREVAQ